MTIDYTDFDPIIGPDKFPEAFDCGAETSFQLEFHCLGDGSCSRLNPIQDYPRDQVTLEALLERELKDHSISFASNDDVAGIEGTQREEADRTDNFHSISAPKISADKQAIEPLLHPETIDCDAEIGVISDGYRQGDGTNSDETSPSNSGETDSSAAEERNSTATHNILGVGTFRIEKTSSDGFLCGMYALEISTDKQLAGDILTPAVFTEIFRSPEMRAFNRQKGYRNRKNFYDEQLACVLGIWGRRKGYDRLQLGLVLEGGLCYIVGAEEKIVFVDSESVMKNELDLGFTTIWIHNNNIMSSQGAAINHYSGVTLLDTNEEQKQARRKEAEKRKEKAGRQEAVLERLEAIRRPLEEPQEREEPQKKRLKFRHGD